ncbi:unnamed protein product [Blepharisma stoltei]|uniref:Golgin subfamily A member 7/ERF4 domain-containing protein n=1 Tax=Blepharisma stoltei TaxID=1481888 RepID=A0AAU9J770_9CILI|nr:unnamed protein product [Blepharisma stoltei]
MDCYFNKRIPNSKIGSVIIRPTSKTFVSGLSSSYDEKYPEELKDIMTENEFIEDIKEINDSLFYYWPCFFCFNFGYTCCICTLGLSFLGPWICVDDAQKRTNESIKKINERYIARNIKWYLMCECSTSWIEIRYG